MSTVVATRNISANQLTDLARTIVDRTETDTQKECGYCHMDIWATDRLKSIISEFNYNQRVSFPPLSALNLKVIYAGKATDCRYGTNIVCLARLKLLDEEDAKFYRVGFSLGTGLKPTFDEAHYCPNCGRHLVEDTEE